jgi:hypothetical protein
VTEFVTWCGFFGAWLLVAGPVFQASIELSEEGFERSRFADMSKSVESPEPISSWWWLVPPVRYWLERRRQHDYRERILSVMSAEDLEALISFGSKAMGWLYVGMGGFLIAVKETYSLVEEHEWPAWFLFPIVAVMAFIALFNTVVRNSRSREMKARNAGQSS